MKTATIYRPVNARTYPNAASRKYHLRRFLDGVLAIATAVGGFTALIFLILL